MDPNKKIVDMTNEELTALGFMGQNVPAGVKRIVEAVKAAPANLGSVTCFAVECLRRDAAKAAQQDDATDQPDSPTFPTSPTLSDTRDPLPAAQHQPDARTVVAPDVISEYEKTFYYHGISGNPPQAHVAFRSRVQPLPYPPVGTHFYKIPEKTPQGVFNTPLNDVWDSTVAPQILESMKARGLKYSALKTARFSIVEDGKKERLGPIVIWIAVRPNTTNAGAVRDATPAILDVLTRAQITGVVVEWYEGSVVRLDGPPLMRAERIPIARQSDDAQGTLTFLFKEVKTKSGEPSDRILALTNKHVASPDTTTDYELDEADPQHILICSDRRFTRAITEIQNAVTTGLRDAARLAGELKDTPKDDTSALRRTRNALEYKHEDNANLQALFDEVDANWKDTNGRRFGVVDWAPRISVRVDNRHYTRDIATFAVDNEKLGSFERNIVDLGNQYTAGQLEDLFWPLAAVREGRTVPANLQLPIRRALPRRLVINPDTEDRNGGPLYIVAKYGNTTKLTLGRYSGMDAYTCTDLGQESREVVVYNYGKNSSDFSDHGDSGSLIFTGDGDALAILHSGMPRGLHNHVTYGTPIWWVIKLILEKYPSAKFYGIVYTIE
ncbi:hypothetical protein BOTBODRAFT_55258 [Botryobasidium botryosum FD-172 SS1]|uniref:Uncharacterized protein n=1 Tax=Botryobasidium botryosum (strain FD-172 SS1) TaxID=930990 RepID=A0A067MG27_BOTB1|nr:hypothetical protein BOTBODRAFT_55258 [Botryobasidium botryosum FD-172 SS1]